MSAWKKPSRSAWVRKVWITRSESRIRSKPVARSAAQVAEVDPARPLQRQHPPSRGLPDHRRHPEAEVALAVRRELGGRRGLHAQVELALHHPLEVVDHRPRPQPPREGRQQLDQARREVEGVDVAQEGPLDPRPQHLDRHHLPGRRASSRGAPGRARPRPPAARSSRTPPRAAARARCSTAARASSIGNGGSLSCSTLELVGELRPDHVRPRRQQLAELDVGRPERGQRPEDRRLARVALEPEPLERPAEHPRRRPERRRRVERGERRRHRPGALEGRAGADQPPEVVRSAHLRASSPSAAPRCPSRGCGSAPGRSRPSAIMPAKVSWSGKRRIDSTRYW